MTREPGLQAGCHMSYPYVRHRDAIPPDTHHSENGGCRACTWPVLATASLCLQTPLSAGSPLTRWGPGAPSFGKKTREAGISSLFLRF